MDAEGETSRSLFLLVFDEKQILTLQQERGNYRLDVIRKGIIIVGGYSGIAQSQIQELRKNNRV